MTNIGPAHPKLRSLIACLDLVLSPPLNHSCSRSRIIKGQKDELTRRLHPAISLISSSTDPQAQAKRCVQLCMAKTRKWQSAQLISVDPYHVHSTRAVRSPSGEGELKTASRPSSRHIAHKVATNRSKGIRHSLKSQARRQRRPVKLPYRAHPVVSFPLQSLTFMR